MILSVTRYVDPKEGKLSHRVHVIRRNPTNGSRVLNMHGFPTEAEADAFELNLLKEKD